MRRTWWFGLLLFACSSYAANSWRCEQQALFICHQDGCSQRKPTIRIKVDSDASKVMYQRCDNKHCVTYPASLDQQGNYIRVITENKNAILKINMTDKRFFETSSILLDAFVAFGQCTGA